MPACLLIDDNEVNLVVAKRMIEKLGFTVTAADSVEAALPHIVDRHTIDVVVLDWHLPGMSGIEFLKKLRATDLGRKTAIFIYSGVEDEEGIQEALNAGADGFIPKPITSEKIVQEFRKVRLL